MQLSCDQVLLREALRAVSPAVGRTYMPGSEGILFQADGRLEVVATNGEFVIRRRVDAQVFAEGAVMVPARTMCDLIELLSGDVTVTTDEKNVVEIASGRTQAHVRGREASEFPDLPAACGDPVAWIETAVLQSAIRRVAYAASKQPDRPMLGSVQLRLEGDRATLVAADGFRLAAYTFPLAEGLEESLDLLIPAGGIQQAKQFQGERVALSLDEQKRHVLLESQDISITCCLVDQEYFDYHAVVPTEWQVKIVEDRAALQQACRTAKAMGEAAARLQLAPGKLTLSCASALVGEGKTTLAATVEGIEGDEMEILLSRKYLAEAVNAMAGEEVALMVQGPSSPVVVRPMTDDEEGEHGAASQVAVIMPMGLGQ
jgi:DNA polymerase-3 subunit beta